MLHPIDQFFVFFPLVKLHLIDRKPSSGVVNGQEHQIYYVFNNTYNYKNNIESALIRELNSDSLD
jgi:hypothetical protein